MRRGVEPTVRALVGVAVVLGVAALPAAPAQAGLTGIGSSAAQTVASGKWQAVATTNSAGPYSNAALALTFAKNGSSAPPAQYFYVVNVGALTLIGGIYSAAVSPSANTVIEACSGTWNETTGACVGTVSTVGSSTGSPASSATAPTAAGSRIRLRTRITTSVASTTTVTVGVNVTRTQVRAATTTTG